ncbi:hypothetical protein [Rubinisphaera margarita]|uniref:hypothetical protein n=1 Tax=Rubinisphaera margarita TaxID=2909586 RepID=UPI001EE86E86|nr:hypothetical protein [Rubinisphaera margarita]
MRNYTSESFGLLIAYLIPGSIMLWGIGQWHPEVLSWLGTVHDEQQSIGGFLYGTVASIACGLVASTVRWLLIDPIHHWTGVSKPKWNLSVLYERTTAFEILVEIHYRYYQFYANCLIAGCFAMLAHWIMDGIAIQEICVAASLIPLFFVASRDTLSKYYSRVEVMLEKQKP